MRGAANTATIERREHYLGTAGPRDGSGREMARWLLALALRRDGRTDAVIRADEILPKAGKAACMVELAPRERGAFAVAMYAGWSSVLKWPLPRIALAFGVERDWACDVIAATAADVADAPPFREGVTDVCCAVHDWVVGGE